jgi:molecular chaperone HtpG
MTQVAAQAPIKGAHTPAGAIASGPETPTAETDTSKEGAVAAGPETPVTRN